MQSVSNVTYRINRDDAIVFVSEAWDRFALRNDAPDVVAEKVLQRSLWDFIKDETTSQLYREMLKMVRGGKILQFNFNCDSPGKVRFIEMVVSAEKNQGFSSRRALCKQKRASRKPFSKEMRRERVTWFTSAAGVNRLKRALENGKIWTMPFQF